MRPQVKGQEKGRELKLTNHFHHSCSTLRAVGGQQAKYKPTPQSCLTLRTVGCDWKRRGDWTIINCFKTFYPSKNFNFFIFKLRRRLSIAQSQSFQSSEINRLLVAQVGEVTLSLSEISLTAHLFSSRSKSLHLSRAHSLMTLNISQEVMGGFLIFISVLSGNAVNCHHYAFQHGAWFDAIPDWDSKPRFRFAGPRC